VKAYVLAAGYATRMYPLTRDRPKTLLEVGGKPILSHVIGRLHAIAGLTQVVLVTNERFFQQIEAWLEAQTPQVPFTLLSDGTTSDETKLGALGDLRLALDRVPAGEEDVVVLASDHMMDLDLGEVQHAFDVRGQTTVVVRRVRHGPGPSRYNDVVLDDDGRIVRFREKPADPEGDLAAIALYFFPRDAIGRLDEYLLEGNPDAPGHFISWLADREPCYAYMMRTAWYDIGSLESYADARARFDL
jgi:glucose-1-phosphate thymidylyltransferase